VIVLDTNVLSALIASAPVEKVVLWLDMQPASELYLNAITLFEVRTGIESLVRSRRRGELERALDDALASIFEGRVLPFDAGAALAAAKLAAGRKRLGRTRDTHDTQIAGIALSHGAAIATRNVRHFSDLEVPVIDPWSVH